MLSHSRGNATATGRAWGDLRFGLGATAAGLVPLGEVIARALPVPVW